MSNLNLGKKESSIGRDKVEVLDHYLRLQERSNDHQLRAVLHLDSRIDLNALKRALRLSLEHISILSCGYIETSKGPCWDDSLAPYPESDYLAVVEGELTEEGLVSALTRVLDYSRGPQVFATVFRQTARDSLCFVVNHMALDRSGLKSYLYELAGSYDRALPSGGKLECKPGKEIPVALSA